MPTPNSASNMVILSCKHTATFSPPAVKGDEVYCRKCGNFRLVDVATAEWRIRCRYEYGCQLSVRYGADESRAKRSAIRHVARYPSHTVAVLQGDRLDALVQANDQVIPGSLPDSYHIVIKP